MEAESVNTVDRYIKGKSFGEDCDLQKLNHQERDHTASKLLCALFLRFHKQNSKLLSSKFLWSGACIFQLSRGGKTLIFFPPALAKL